MKANRTALAFTSLILLGCAAGTIERDREVIQGFEFYSATFMKVEIPIPIGAIVDEGQMGVILHGQDYQFSVSQIKYRAQLPSLDSIVSGFCTFSKKKSDGTVTVLYEVKNEFGHWIRFDTNCPLNEATWDIMIARIGTGTLLLTILDGTTDAMAAKIEKAFLQAKKYK